MEQEPFNAGDETSVQKRKTKAQLKKEKETEDLRKVLSTREGVNVIWKILEKCALFDISFTGNSTTFFKEGRRSIGHEILADINQVDKRAFALMQLNAIDEQGDN